MYDRDEAINNNTIRCLSLNNMKDINVQGTECDRCGDFFTGEPIKLSCGTLCETCVQVRMFDADNPVLYPIKK